MALDSRQLRYFVAVARAGSVNRAAGALNIAQPALSRRIQQLEQELGAPLFVRSRTGIRLSEAGEALLARAEPVLAEFDRLEQEVSQMIAQSRAPLKLGINGSAAAVLLDHLLGRFHERCPAVPIQVVQGQTLRLQEALLADQLDLAILTNPTRAKGFKITPLWREGVFIVVANALAPGGRVALDRLAGLPFILTSRSPGVRAMIEEAFGRLGMKLEVHFDMEATASVKRMCERGEAFTVLPYPSIARELAEGRFVAEPLPGARISHGLVWRIGRPMPKAVGNLTAVLKDILAEQLPQIPGAEKLRDNERRSG